MIFQGRRRRRSRTQAAQAQGGQPHESSHGPLMVIVFALLAALSNAVNEATQHIASTVAPRQSSGWRLVVYLFRNPLWRAQHQETFDRGRTCRSAFSTLPGAAALHHRTRP